jgi:hypothetical protein
MVTESNDKGFGFLYEAGVISIITQIKIDGYSIGTIVNLRNQIKGKFIFGVVEVDAILNKSFGMIAIKFDGYDDTLVSKTIGDSDKMGLAFVSERCLKYKIESGMPLCLKCKSPGDLMVNRGMCVDCYDRDVVSSKFCTDYVDAYKIESVDMGKRIGPLKEAVFLRDKLFRFFIKFDGLTDEKKIGLETWLKDKAPFELKVGAKTPWQGENTVYDPLLDYFMKIYHDPIFNEFMISIQFKKKLDYNFLDFEVSTSS